MKRETLETREVDERPDLCDLERAEGGGADLPTLHFISDIFYLLASEFFFNKAPGIGLRRQKCPSTATAVVQRLAVQSWLSLIHS